MTGPAGLLDFYILEATEYLDQIDAALASSGRGAPDTGPFLTAARALRGSSTMARRPQLAELAGAIERVGRAVREGALGWSETIRATLVASVDDFRLLLRAVRTWGAEEDRRVASRVAELRPLVSGTRDASASTPESGVASAVFFATELEAVANSLDAFTGNSRDPRPLDQALARVRALRGIAALRDFPPLPDVADAIERAASVRSEGGAVSTQRATLFAASTALLRRIAQELRSDGRADPASAELGHFVAASAALDSSLHDERGVVPIARLFFADGGPHLVNASAEPPVSAEGRFRTEIVTHAEHLRRLVADARAAADLAARDRAARELRAGLRGMRQLAESYGVHDVARFFAEAASDEDALEPVLLASLDDAATLLASASTTMEQVRERIAEMSRGRMVDRAIGLGFEPIDAPRRARTTPRPRLSPPFAPAVAGPRGERKPSPSPWYTTPITPPGAVPAAAAPPSAPPAAPSSAPAATTAVARAAETSKRSTSTPTGSELRALLQEGIAGFRELDEVPLAKPAPLEDAALIPIDALVYRGRAALARALEVRDEIRTAGAPTRPALDELFDLLDLAATE